MTAPSLSPRRAWPASFPAGVAALDLRKPALIEASAGTGKTYAIEHLVLRLVVENPGWKPESLLLLSFTEKTAGELRERIRERLREEAEKSADPGTLMGSEPERRRLREAWLQCDDISVHTLHGFCHAALRRYPLENGALFTPEVMDEKTLLEEALEALLRGAWARDGERLRALRDALDMNGGEGWRGKLIVLALAYQPDRGDRIEPAADPENARRLEQALAEGTRRLESALRDVEAGSFPASAFRATFKAGKTGQEALRKDGFNKVFLAAEEGAEARRSWPAFFKREFTQASRVVKLGFAACLAPEARERPEWIRLAEACDLLRKSGALLEESRRLESLAIKGEAARELRAALDTEKQRRGALSYDDMVSKLVRALRSSEAFAERLRRRYNACIVDEFQDTDPLQWELLRILCLGGGESPGEEIPLFLVGDPKQAIYGFRGGDLDTYLEARALLQRKARAGEAQGAGLVENWRSRPELIAGLNAVFARASWFGEAGEVPSEGAWRLPERSSGIVFTPARIPGKKSLPPGVPGPAIFWRDFSPIEKKGEAEKTTRGWIANRIADLVDGKTGLRIPVPGGADRAPVFGDIAVLARTNHEAQALEKHLRGRGIPGRLHRRSGLWHGALADAVRLLLDFLENPAAPETQAKIRLLPFLRRGAADWPRGIPAECPPLILRWEALARAGRWTEFFASVLQESGYLYRLAAATALGSEVRDARALAQNLAEEGMRAGPGARALGERLDALRRGEDTEAGAAAEEEEGEANGGAENRVSLLTLHMSKGLEFPVVFLAAAGESRKPDFFTVRDAGGFRHVLDKRDAEAAAAFQAQAREEQQRLYYVAFTRARDRLYVPVYAETFRPSRPGGALGGFAAAALREATVLHPDWIREETPEDDGPSPFAKGFPAPLKNFPRADEAEGEIPAWPVTDPWEGVSARLFARQRRLSSYSHMAQRAKLEAATAAETLLEADGTRMQRDESGPEGGETDAAESEAATSVAEEPGTPFATREDLPPGAGTGNALHALLERTDFSAARDAESADAWIADPRRLESVIAVLRQHGLGEEFAAAAGRLVWNTLRMPLPDPAGGESFCLADAAGPSDRRHEVEFLFPFSGKHETPPEETRSSPGFLWGFIDLVFRHRDRYYLLDWKSNTLDRYDEAAVRESMEHHRYDLQYRLYAVALDKWLAARLPGYDPALHFGGVFYLYLRGASPGRFSGFSHRPSPDELRRTWPARLRETLGIGPDYPEDERRGA